jgi:hypothetical protein
MLGGVPLDRRSEVAAERRLVNVAEEMAIAAGLPVVYGEHVRRGGGYHHYPSLERVGGWVREAGLQVLEDDHSEGDGYGYYHLLTRS